MSEVATAAPAPEPKPRRLMVLTEPRIGMREYRIRDHAVDAEEGTTVQDLVDPGYWAHVASHFEPLDRIEVRLETGGWVAELIVLARGTNWAKVKLLQHYELDGVAEDTESKAHIIKWRGPQHRHCIVRIADHAIIQSGFDSKEAGAAWLRNFESTLLK